MVRATAVFYVLRMNDGVLHINRQPSSYQSVVPTVSTIYYNRFFSWCNLGINCLLYVQHDMWSASERHPPNKQLPYTTYSSTYLSAGR